MELCPAHAPGMDFGSADHASHGGTVDDAFLQHKPNFGIVERMTNADVADAFALIAKILDLKGENRFRVRAYDRAAQIVGAWPRDLGEVYREGGTKALEGVTGIGKDLALKIEEMVKTGKLKFLRDLKKTIPPGLLIIMDIEGMGPKKTKLVWEKLNVQTVKDLERAATSGQLAALPRWGEQSAANILRAIASKRSLGTRMALPAALALAEGIVVALRTSRLCAKIEIAGSIRRRKDTIGDIDILVTSTKPKKVMDIFTTLPQAKRVIGKGPTKATVMLSAGITADLRVLEPRRFGAALYYFTGSKDHNVAVRSLAVKKGITINEYGAFRGTSEKKGKLLASATEEDIFASVGLPYIPPELRENRGEIGSALHGGLPTLIEEKDLRGDLHVHSDFSDGGADMVTMARAAKAKGLSYIAITDHGSGMGMVKGVKSGNIGQYLELIEKARAAVPGIHILTGVEVDIEADGRLYLPDDVLRKLDWVVASVHSHMRQSPEEMTKRLLRAIEHPFVRVIGHPTTRLLLKRAGVEFSLETVFKAAAKRGIAMELNASIYRLDLNDIHCKLAKDLGVKICIDSDAHDPAELDYRFGIAQARRGWLEKKDVINAMSWEKFEMIYTHD